MKQRKSDITDERILHVMQRDTDRGFRLLMAKYQERLYWQIRRMVFDHQDADDVLQNCFIKVYRSIGRFEGRSKLHTWLYRIAANESITFINRKRNKQTSSLNDAETAVANQLKADRYFDGDEAQRCLQEAIARLPEKQKMVFILRYYDEMNYSDMSAVLDTSEGALKASFHHAVKKIEAHVRRMAEG